MKRNKIPTWMGFAGGAVFFILNIVTKGQIPGGFKGGVLGFIIGYALGWLVLVFIPAKSSEKEKE